MAQKKTAKKLTANEKYMQTLYETVKKRERFAITNKATNFNDTELALLAEIISAAYEGERLISTQLADRLGITRSAVSQIVNRLEKDGIVKRVADEVDRKIAYIDFTEKAIEVYQHDWKLCQQYVGKVVKRFGEERFYQLCSLSSEFLELLEEEKHLVEIKRKPMV